MKLQKKDANGSKIYNIEECLEKISGINGTVDDINAKLEKISGIAEGAEVNQNAFSKVKVFAAEGATESTTISADMKKDTLTIAAGSNITLTPDAAKDKITIAATDTVYTHPSYTVRTGVPTANAAPAFGGTFSVTQPKSDTTGHITEMNTRTITIPSSTATTSAAGLMSATDKTKLDAMMDYIVEQRIVAGIGSTTSNWGYRKWNSGYAECYLKMPIEKVACTTKVGSWYSTAVISPPNFPFQFTYYPTVNMYFETISGTGGMVWSTGTSSATPTTKPINVYIIRMTSSASITGYLNIYAIGKWK